MGSEGSMSDDHVQDDHVQEKTSLTRYPALSRGRDEDGPPEGWKIDVTREEPRAMDVFVAWEKLRLLYNLILVAAVALFLNPVVFLLSLPIFLPFLLEGALIANIGFCAGPVAEGYLCLLGMSRRPVRALVFVCGTLVAIGLTWYALFLPIHFVNR